MMRFFLAIFFLILFFYQQVVATPPPPPPPPPAIPPTYFLMVLQWSRAYCKEKALTMSNPPCPRNYESALGDKFYIHGLWPKPASVRIISDPYDFQVFAKLASNDKQRLLSNWRSAVTAGIKAEGAILFKSSGFWAHEWNDHGQYQTLSQKDYFIFVLDRYDALSQIHQDVVKTFHTKPKADVRVRDVVQYIYSKHRVVVNISCLPYDTGRTTMLYEIYFNFTINGQLQNLTDQRNLHRNPCPDNANAVFI